MQLLIVVMFWIVVASSLKHIKNVVRPKKQNMVILNKIQKLKVQSHSKTRSVQMSFHRGKRV